MGVLEDLKSLLQVSIGVNRILRVHESVHMDPAGVENGKRKEKRCPENLRSSEKHTKVKEPEVQKPQKRSDHREAGHGILHAPVIKAGLWHRHSRRQWYYCPHQCWILLR